MGKTLADGYLEIRPDVNKLGPEMRRAISRVNFAQHGRQAGNQLGEGFKDGFNKGFGDGGSTFGRVLASMAARATVATGGISALTPVVAKFGAAVAPAGGAVVALPAGFAAATAASATFKVAVAGVSDAISKGLYGTATQYNKALADLPPAAQAVARSVVGLKGQIQSLRQSVAQRFFAPMVGDLKPLAVTYVPLLKTEMGGLSSSLGRFGHEVLTVARTAPVLGAVRDVFRQTGANVDILKGAVAPLGHALATLLSSTMPLLTQMSSGVVTLAQRFDAWVTTASQTGRLTQIWNNAVTTIRNLWAIFGNLNSIVRDVFGYSNVSASDFLVKLKDLTGQAARWVDSAQGARVISGIFDRLSAQGATLRDTLGGVFPKLAEAARIAAPVVQALSKALGDTLVNLSPLLPALFGVSAVLLTAAIPAIQGFANWLGRNKDLVQAVAPLLIGFALAAKSVSAALAVAELAGRAWNVVLGVGKGAMAAWTAVNWLAVAPVHAHNAAIALSTSFIGTWVQVKAIEFAAWVRSTAATISDTASKVGNRIAVAATTGVTTALVAIKDLEIGAWIRSTAQIIANRIAMTAAAVTSGVVRAATVAWTAAQWLLNAALTANPIGIVVVAIGALVAAIVYAYKNSETFRNTVIVAWAAVKTAIGAVVSWFTGTILPSLTTAYTQLTTGFTSMKNGIVGAWNAVKDGIANSWNWVRDNVFNPIKNFITQTIPNAFRDGTAAIGRFWDGLKELARKPVSFVVNSVINPLIRGYNLVGGIFKAPHVNEIAGFAAGGRIPGPASPVDNLLARGPGGRPIALATGEFVVNAEDTSRNLAALKYINSGGRLPGFADGGLIGGIGNFLGTVYNGIKGVGSFIVDPVGGLKKLFNAAMNAIPGAGFIIDVLKGMGTKIFEGVKGILGFGGGPASFGAWPSSPAAQRGDSGVWHRIVALIRSTGPLSGSFGNGYRPGDPLWHGSGRAVDWMGFNQDALASFLAARRPLELIHRTATRDYAYTRGVNQGSFNESLMQAHRNHIHIAMAEGGLVGRATRIPVFDTGGWARPGLNLINNRTGAMEHLTPTTDIADLAAKLDRTNQLLDALAGRLADALAGNTRRAVQLGRGRPATAFGQAL